MDRLSALKEITGITLANCCTCSKAAPDWDVDGYSSVYCGMTCADSQSGCYLEDMGIDIQAEHICWVPEFWVSDFAKHMNGTISSFEDAYEEFKQALEKVSWS